MVKLLLLVACLSAGVATSAVGDDLDDLAQELVKLRSQVEEYNAELDILQQELKSDLSGIAAQRADLEAQRNRNDVQIGQLKSTLEENKKKAEAAGADSSTLEPILLDAIARLDTQVRGSLPFKIDERLQAIDELRLQIEGGRVDAPRAANRLWAFYEDEIRLTRENGLYSQTILLDGKSRLADVAKLGTTALYFRTDDDRYGQVARQGDGWQWRVIENSDAVAQIEGLFDALTKQIRQGYFTLPQPFAAMGSAR